MSEPTNLTPESIAAMSDRDKEIACAKECGLTVELHLPAGKVMREPYYLITDKRKATTWSGFYTDESQVWNAIAPRYLTDAAANDTLLDESDRRVWGWTETGFSNRHEPFTCEFSSYKNGAFVSRALGFDRRRVRVEAFLAACAAEKGGAG